MINICVNGLFRYDKYIKEISDLGVLNKFYYSHRISTSAHSLHIDNAQANNIWLKEYALHSLLRIAPGIPPSALMTTLGDFWQRAVISQWRDAEVVQAVIGELADHILEFAQKRGARTVGHPVTSHPAYLVEALKLEHDLIGLRTPDMSVSNRRLHEISLCDSIIVDSSIVAKSFVNSGYPKQSIKVLTPGADISRFSARNPNDRDRTTFRALSVGAVTPRKGHKYLLEAWKNVDTQNKELTIVGATTSHTNHILGPYEGSFRYIQNVPNVDLRDLIVKASAFVLPSIEDGFAQAAMEALTCGVPVICTSTAGIADLIVDGVNGWVVDPRDHQAIAERLNLLAHNPDMAVEMGENAATMSLQTGSWSKYARELVDHLNLRPI
jgi:glycosyltransferase involved in cell wall biosynthesis